jgi:3D (Asp-Asp-Asp) domain-containing protein
VANTTISKGGRVLKDNPEKLEQKKEREYNRDYIKALNNITEGVIENKKGTIFNTENGTKLGRELEAKKDTDKSILKNTTKNAGNAINKVQNTVNTVETVITVEKTEKNIRVQPVILSSRSEKNPSKVLQMEATAYTHTGHLTYTGTAPQIGTIAVDPKVIPLGTKMYVEGYSYGVAQDIGGVIKGNKIDLFMDTRQECFKWGCKNVNVYIYK